MTREHRRLLVAVLATVAVLAPLGYLWWQSRVPGEYSVMDMGYADYGGGPHAPAGMPGMRPGMRPGGDRVSVAGLVADPHRKADVTVDLTARRQTFRLASGRRVDGYTVNGRSPGPLIEVTQGQLVEVHLTNASVPDGITLHWHGVDVPNAEDGVAGVTQNAVRIGQTYTYRFVAKDAGTYWYHSHQVSHEQVVGGLLGPLVVRPRHPARSVVDRLALAHTYDGYQTLNGREGVTHVDSRPGQTVRVRVVNTDIGPVATWASAPYTLAAVDGRDLHGPTPVTGRRYVVPAGGRADLKVQVPADGSGVRVQVGASTALTLGPPGVRVPEVPEPRQDLDLLSYGTPAPLGFDAGHADRHFEFSIGRRPGFVNGVPGLWWSINGHLFPDVPMFVVDKGDIVAMHIDNHSGDVHPMHLHGHHAVVLARDGRPSTGSPWWVDSLDVANGDSYDIAFVADNPGVWMDHCHNLTHAAQGLVAHLMYAGVTEPYEVGGPSGNEPE